MWEMLTASIKWSKFTKAGVNSGDLWLNQADIIGWESSGLGSEIHVRGKNKEFFVKERPDQIASIIEGKKDGVAA